MLVGADDRAIPFDVPLLQHDLDLGRDPEHLAECRAFFRRVDTVSGEGRSTAIGRQDHEISAPCFTSSFWTARVSMLLVRQKFAAATPAACPVAKAVPMTRTEEPAY